MIRKPGNWNDVKGFSDVKTLPAGAYVCLVRDVRVEKNSYGDVMLIAFDIAEGEHAGYYEKLFNAAAGNANRKWKGVLRQWLPKDDGSEKDEMTKRTFKSMTGSFERSNAGYTWDWNEASLVGKTIGILFRREEWRFDGKTGWATRPMRTIDADRVRTGDFTVPDDKPLMGDANDAGLTYNAPVKSAPAAQAAFTAVECEDLPF